MKAFAVCTTKSLRTLKFNGQGEPLIYFRESEAAFNAHATASKAERTPPNQPTYHVVPITITKR